MSRNCSTNGSTTQPTNHYAVSSSVQVGVKVLAVIIGLAAALAVAGAAPATPAVPGQIGALKAIRVALAAGRIDGATANAGRAEIARAAHLVRTLPSGRREHVAVALEQLASFSGRLTAPRTLALVGQLKANDDYFAKHYAPGPKTDVTDDDGLVYRYFPGRCLEFHPLAQLRRAQRTRGRERRGGRAAPRRRADRARCLPAGRRNRLGVLLRLLRRPRTVALGNGAGRRGAGVRTNGGARTGRGGGAHARGARCLPGRSPAGCSRA